MTHVVTIELAVSTDKNLTIFAINPLLVIMVVTEMNRLIRASKRLCPAPEESKVLCEGSNVSVLDRIDCLTRGALDIAGCRSVHTGIVTSGGPLATSISDVQYYLLIFIFVRNRVENSVKAF